MSQITDEIRKSASEMYHGHDICQAKSRELLTMMNLPNGLLPLQEIVEVGYVKDTGFVWLIQKQKCEHKFVKIGKPCQYQAEVTAFVEPNKIKKLTGVKSKELMLWVTLCDIYVDDPPTGKITFKTPTGLSRSFPVSAFELEEEEVKKDLAVLAEFEKEKEKEKSDAEEKNIVSATEAPPPATAAVEVKEV